MRLLLFCFASEGKTALLTLVLQQLVRNFSKLSVTVVTSKNCIHFFYNVPGVHVIPVDFEENYRHFWGLYRLYRELWQLGPYDGALDLQCNLRTFLLRFYFFFSGLSFVSMNVMPRSKSKDAVNDGDKSIPGFAVFNKIEHYFATFARAGLFVSHRQRTRASGGSWISLDIRSRAKAYAFVEKKKQSMRKKRWVALIPFTDNEDIPWSVAQVNELILKIQQEYRAGVFLFVKDRKKNLYLRRWYNKRPQVVVVCPAHWNRGIEMAVMKRMQLIISMDENYMCLAALLGVRMLYIEKAPAPPYASRHKHQFWFPRQLSRLSHASMEEVIEAIW